MAGGVDRRILEKDRPSHRLLSNKLDKTYGGKAPYEKFVRPLIHSAYHAGRAIKSKNKAEWDRAKDQFSKVSSMINCELIGISFSWKENGNF